MSARDRIADRLWLTVPSKDNDEARAGAEQMLDALRVENRHEAADWLASYPFPPASSEWERSRDAGVAWAVDCLRVEHPQRADGERAVSAPDVRAVVHAALSTVQGGLHHLGLVALEVLADRVTEAVAPLVHAGAQPYTVVTEWGVRLPGRDQYVAVRPTERAAYEDAASMREDGVKAVVVSRTAHYGDWTNAGGGDGR